MMSWFLKGSKRQKEERFLLNGKTLLKELIASSNGKYNPYRSFTDKEIKIATNSYDQQNFITDGWRGSLYNGFLQDRLVSVLKFSDKCTKYGINSIVFASQMRHKFFLKLIGCCLETEAPILVFEHVENGTLADRIYRSCEQHFEPLLLTHRLKIAMEIANAIAYLHFGFSRPIIFRLIDPRTIVFTEQYVTKLFDFSDSVAIPEGETHVRDDRAQGKSGFLAPELPSTFNEKIDVYSFGALLLELLTGLHMSDIQEEVETLLEDRVKKCIEQNRFTEIIHPIIVGTEPSLEKEQLLLAVTELALKCLSRSEEDRPTMIDVAKQLRQMYKSTC